MMKAFETFQELVNYCVANNVRIDDNWSRVGVVFVLTDSTPEPESEPEPDSDPE